MRRLRLHLTNVTGAGATQLAKCLLPAFEDVDDLALAEIHLPNCGVMACYRPRSDSVKTSVYPRSLPNFVSRFLECTLFASRFDGALPLLVLGDIPLRCKAPQAVFVQTSHLFSSSNSKGVFDRIRFMVARLVFWLNARYASRFIVQTPLMKSQMIQSYPTLQNRVHVIGQPVPIWLLQAGLIRKSRIISDTQKLSLVYPAAGYPHKNHRLLSKIGNDTRHEWPIKALTLTIPADKNPARDVRWIKCVGFLSEVDMVKIYGEVDALLFLSTDESYGFPLLEAMFVGLPIVCPDLPYARTLCGDREAIYFNPYNIGTLRKALHTLYSRLNGGWWPDWSDRLVDVPNNWAEVAKRMSNVALERVSAEDG